jgi:hypothetical protein
MSETDLDQDEHARIKRVLQALVHKNAVLDILVRMFEHDSWSSIVCSWPIAENILYSLSSSRISS